MRLKKHISILIGLTFLGGTASYGAQPKEFVGEQDNVPVVPPHVAALTHQIAQKDAQIATQEEELRQLRETLARERLEWSQEKLHYEAKIAADIARRRQADQERDHSVLPSSHASVLSTPADDD